MTRNPLVTGGEMYGGRAGTVLGETLWRHLSQVDSRDRTPFTPFLQLRDTGHRSLRRSAIQGFGEDCTGAATTHHGTVTVTRKL